MSATPALLVITLSNVGDVVMTTPVMEALAAAYPASRIDVVADARSSDLLAAAPWLGRLYHRHKRGGAGAQWRLWRALRRTRYEVVADLRTGFLPYLLRARHRLVKPPRDAARPHAVEEHFAVLAPLLGAASPPPCRLHLADPARAAASALLADLPGRRWLAIAPGANWPGKRWPAQRYRDLLALAASDFDAAIVLGGRGDLETPFDGAGLTLAHANLVDRTTLPVAAAVLARAAAFVGNDSGLGHMAAALGVPTLTVFGPGQPARYRPWGARTHVVYAPDDDLAALDAATVHARLRALAPRD